MTDEIKAAQPGLEALVADIIKLGRLSAALGRSIYLPGPDTNAMGEFEKLEKDVLTRVCELYAEKSGHIADGGEILDMYKRKASQENQLSNAMLALGKIADGAIPQPRESARLAIKHITREAPAPAQPVAAQPAATFTRHNKGGSGEFIGVRWNMPFADTLNLPDEGALFFAAPAPTESEDAEDAARYRWLTYAGWIDDAIMAEHGINDGISETLDSAIDAAIAASKSKGGVHEHNT